MFFRKKAILMIHGFVGGCYDFFNFQNELEIIKKVKKDESTTKNTFWMTTSFILIVWSISLSALFSFTTNTQ